MVNRKVTNTSGAIKNRPGTPSTRYTLTPVEDLIKTGDRFLGPSAAAEVLDTSVNTLNYWRCVGKGPKFYRQGRNVRYLKSDLLAWGRAVAVDPEKRTA
jgi:hypothetical protein